MSSKLASGLPAISEGETKKILQQQEKYDWKPLVVGGGLGAMAVTPLIIGLRGRTGASGLISKALPKNPKAAYAIGLGGDFILSGGAGLLGMHTFRKIRASLKDKKVKINKPQVIYKSASLVLEFDDMYNEIEEVPEDISLKFLGTALGLEKNAGLWATLKGTERAAPEAALKALQKKMTGHTLAQRGLGWEKRIKTRGGKPSSLRHFKKKKYEKDLAKIKTQLKDRKAKILKLTDDIKEQEALLSKAEEATGKARLAVGAGGLGVVGGASVGVPLIAKKLKDRLNARKARKELKGVGNVSV